MMRRNPNFHCYALFSRRETKAVVEAARSNSMRWRLARAQMIVMTNELNTFFFPFFKFFFGMESCSALSQFLHLFLFSGRTRVWCLRLIRKKKSWLQISFDKGRSKNVNKEFERRAGNYNIRLEVAKNWCSRGRDDHIAVVQELPTEL